MLLHVVSGETRVTSTRPLNKFGFPGWLMDGWMDGWMNRWMTDRWVDGSMDGWIDGWMD